MRSWVEKERYDGEVVDCLTLILPTVGCSWDSCYMCGFTLESDKKATQKSIFHGFLKAVESKKAEILKIFTSGSFFDEREVSRETREKIYRKALELGFRKIVVESRPEFIDEKVAEEIKNSGMEIEVGIGVETSNDLYREYLINKGFSFDEFVRASKILKGVAKVKAYLLLKPPFLTEREAVEDVLKSILDVKRYVDVISLNLMTVHRKTVIERIWRKGVYRPPWLWSAVEILKRADAYIICDPVGGGKKRGPHNCFRCDGDVVREIKLFSLYQDKKVFKKDCECFELWKLSMDAEELTDLFIFP